MHRTRIAGTTLMLQVTSAVAHREARTHGRFSLALLRPLRDFQFSFSCSIFLPQTPPLTPFSSSSLPRFLTRLPNSRYLHALTYKSGHFGKIDTSYRYKSNRARIGRPRRAPRYHFRSTILHCASRVSNTCSKQSARGPLCTVVR